MEWLSRKSAKRCAVTQSAEEKQRGLVLVPALPSGKESRLLLKADSATQGPVSVPVVISESQSASYDVLSMGMILSAFEELKTGRKVEYCVTVAPGISPLRSDQVNSLANGVRARGMAFSGGGHYLIGTVYPQYFHLFLTLAIFEPLCAC